MGTVELMTPRSPAVTQQSPSLSYSIERRAPEGLKGLIVADTAVGTVEGDRGFYHYRGHDAARFAGRHSFEDVVGLLVQTDDVERRLAAVRASIDPEAVQAACAGFTPGESPLGPLVAGLWACVDTTPTVDLDLDGTKAAALHAIGAAPVILAGASRVLTGEEALAADPTLGHAADYLRMATGRPADPEAVRALEVYLNLTAEHGFNASTFAARVITSAGASVPAALGGAVGALSGPLHGGAPSRVLDMINQIGDPDQAEEWAGQKLAAGDKLMGFGHAVYRHQDPRSETLRAAAESFTDPAARDLVARAVEIEQRLLSVLARQRAGRRFVTNVEYYAAIVLHLAGLSQDLFTPTFVVSRVVGWSAHVLEQAADNKIMRPSANYVGPMVEGPAASTAE